MESQATIRRILPMFARARSSRRRGGYLTTRLAEDETAPLTAESLDAAITEVDVTHALDDSKASSSLLSHTLSSSLLDGRMASTGQPRHAAPQQLDSSASGSSGPLFGRI